MMSLIIPDEMPLCRSLGRGRWEVCEPWTFVVEGYKTTIPIGFVTDLFSVPWPISLFIPKDQRDNRPALIHDWLYATVGLRETSFHGSRVSWFQANRALDVAAVKCGLSWIQRELIIAGLMIGSAAVWRKYEFAGYSLTNPCLGDFVKGSLSSSR